MGLLNRIIHGPTDNQVQLKGYKTYRLLSYLPDWIITIALFAVTSYFTDYQGFQREFSLTDIDIQHSYAVVERIPFSRAIIYAGIIPAAILILISLLWRRSLWDLHSSILGLLFSLASASVVTDLIKITVGRPRPDWISRCQPIPGAMNAAVYGLSNISICTVKSGSIINDGFKSFPSGHSSFSFAGLGFLAFYLAGKLRLFDNNGYLLKAWICIIPLIGASLIAISRTMDYRHRGTDIIAGGLLGFLMAYFSYYLYYPSLSSPFSHLPLPPRLPASATTSNSDSLSNSTSTVPLNNINNHQPVPSSTQSYKPSPAGVDSSNGVNYRGREYDAV